MIKNINTGICNNFNKIVKRNFKGSYTIEAALIMPIIFIVLAGIIYISFYLHDIVWIQGISYESSHDKRQSQRAWLYVHGAVGNCRGIDKRGV